MVAKYSAKRVKSCKDNCCSTVKCWFFLLLLRNLKGLADIFCVFMFTNEVCLY